MSTFEVEKRLKLYQALAEQIHESKNPPLITDGCVLVKVDGKLHELNVNEQLEWIPLQLKSYDKINFRVMESWNNASLQKLNSAADFKRTAQENHDTIKKLESYHQMFLLIKHLPKKEVHAVSQDQAKIDKALMEAAKRQIPKSKMKGKLECEFDFDTVERLKGEHPEKAASEIFQLAAHERGKSAEAIKGGYYYTLHRDRKGGK